MLDPTATEFIPVVSVASGSSEASEEPPRAVITPARLQSDQPQASTSAPPVVTSVSSTPTTSGTSSLAGHSPSIPSTASVPPTLKRSRESTMAESDSISSGEAGPSGYQKKARTISSTEFLQVSSGGAEVVVMSGVSGSQETSGSSVETSDSSATGERREVGSSSSVNVDTIGISSSEIAASSGVATSSQEEILDCDLDVDDDGEMSEDLEEAEAGDMNPDNLEGTTDEDENNSQQEPEEADVNSEGEIEIDQHQPEVGAVEDNSSEPSSSTGTRRSTVAGAQVFSLGQT